MTGSGYLNTEPSGFLSEVVKDIKACIKILAE
jgi:hypothetical protein